VDETVITGRRGRRNYTLAEKLRIVEATLEPGTSVARVAQAHGVNPNLVFIWRKQHREGRLLAHNGVEARLLPVAMMDAPVENAGKRLAHVSAQAGALHIDLPRGHVRIEGGVDAASLRVVLEMLLR
jgi:transposase